MKNLFRLRWLPACLVPLLLSSCITPKKIQVQVKPVERVPLDLPAIAPLQLDGMNWYVVTESNFAEVIAKLKAAGVQPVFFALDERGYENLSVNMTKIRGYITQQKIVIVSLKDYYGVPDNPEALTPAPSRLAMGPGANIPTVAAVSQPSAPKPAATTSTPAAAPLVPPTAKKGMAKFIPPFLKTQ